MIVAAAAAVAAVALPSAPATATPRVPGGAAAAATPALALSQAAQTGQPVVVADATTATSTLTANPDGSLTQLSSVEPTRKFVSGAWVTLDPTLHMNTDGSVSAAATTSGVVLSGGGDAPLVTLGSPTQSLALTLPMALPRPTLSGATATYAGVLPDVDVIATVDSQGGFSDVVVVHSAAAAANPMLTTLQFGLRTAGLTVGIDNAGNMTATNGAGHTIFAADAPQSWDSAVPATAIQTVPDPVTGVGVDPATGAPVTSSAAGPGEAAHVAALGTTVSTTAIRLSPAALLATPQLTYPLFYDPGITFVPISAGGVLGGYGTIQSGSGTAHNYYKTAPNGGDQQVGYAPTCCAVSRTLINFGIPTLPAGAVISGATLKILETWAYDCGRPRGVEIYAPTGKVLTSTNSDWDDWSSVSLGTQNGPTKTVAYGNNCASSNVSFTVTDGVTAAVSRGATTQTFEIKATDETDAISWKKFHAATATMEIDYDTAPTKPSSLTVSGTACSTPSIVVGDNDVTLAGHTTDPDQNAQNGGTIGVTFTIWKTSAPGTILATYSDTSTYPATTTNQIVLESALKGWAGTTATGFTWRIVDTDGLYNSPPSSDCSFTFDPTRPGSPSVTGPATMTIGVAATFTIGAPTSGPAPAGYMYEVNNAAPQYTTALTGGSGQFSITPASTVNYVTVTSMSAGGNFGSSYGATFQASYPAAAAADGDLTGDGIPDVLAVGGAGTGLPHGLWMAAGTGGGKLNLNATNIGVNGKGDGNTAALDGYQPITGHITGTTLQDVLLYNPTQGDAVIYSGTGNGSPFTTNTGISAIAQTNISDQYGDWPQQIANAGTSAGATGQCLNSSSCPDLIGISGDGTDGFWLTYWQNLGVEYYPIPGVQMSTLTPTGGTDWNNWTIATDQTPTGTTDMFLWNHNVGGLYLWRNLQITLTADPDSGVVTAAFTPTQYTLSTTWKPTGTVAISAADINADGIPDLWDITNTATATAVYVTGLAGGTASYSTQSSQTPVTADHSWALNDNTVDGLGNPTAGDDTTGTAAPLASTGAASWVAGTDVFPTAIALDATGSESLATTTTAVNTAASFTISAWIKPPATGSGTLGGVAFAQDDSHTDALEVWAESTDNSWRFAMSTSNITNPGYNMISAGANSAQPGIWTQVTVTYDATAHRMAIFINGACAATGSHTPSTTPTGAFTIGHSETASSGWHTGYFTGTIAAVQSWNHVTRQPVSYVASTSTNGNATTEAVTVPATVTAGDAMLLFATAAGANAPTAPTGWTFVGQSPATVTGMTTAVYSKVATATDAGSTVTVGFGAVVHGTVQLLDYRGTNTTNPISQATTAATTAATTTLTSPTALAANGSWTVTYWAAKSSAVTAWTTPSSQTSRSIANGTGSGRINSVAVDSAAPLTGMAGGYVATTDQPVGSATTWTITLAQ
jgi:hypothetical protein